MNTPICDFVKKYSQSNISRLHMPGHKGINLTGCEMSDITEISGADSLYAADGIIAESEKNAASLFGSMATYYSTEGSSQCIKAMLYLAKINSKNSDFTVLAARNIHKSFIYACALLDVKIEWLFDNESEFSLCRCNVTPDMLDKKLSEIKADAVYLTSPDYLGGELDIQSLSDVAHSHDAFMLVDNAHGAYLHFLKNPRHPADCGADVCCDSAHKTLPVLTGGAYLHVFNKTFLQDAKRALEIFGSTSPSYLILQSLDFCNAYLATDYSRKLQKCVENVDNLKLKLTEQGWQIEKSDPLKLTICTSGMNLSDFLRKNAIECEYEDPDYTVMMFTPESGTEIYSLLPKILGKCQIQNKQNFLKFSVPEKCCEIREALFSKNKTVSVSDSCGLIVSDTSVSCPPAVPVLVSGEKITQEAIEVFKYYGIEKINVIAY